MAKKSKRTRRHSRNPRRATSRWMTAEDPLQFDDSGDSGLEWLQSNSVVLHEAVRLQPKPDPWLKGGARLEEGEVTEERREKMQELSLDVEEEPSDDEDEFVA